MTDRELMQQALEALEFFRDTAICQADTDVATEAITALSERLAQPEQELVMKRIKTWSERCEEHPDHQQGMISEGMIRARMQEEIDELRQALETEQEPVAWHEPGAYGNVTVYKKWANDNGWLPLYAAPPQRKWQGLTDEEIDDAQCAVDCRLYRSYARAIEAKLKEKNQ